jgi:hypothetical protein
MIKLRNPFKIRASEKLESDASFLKLFSPIALEALHKIWKEEKLWNNVLFIRSSPGAGKTSLLRVFEPRPLRTLMNSRSSPDYRDLFTSLKRMEVLDDHDVKTLGVSITCARNYKILEQLDFSDVRKKRLFFSLMNSRLTITALRSILTLHNESFPEGLKNIHFDYDNSEGYFRNLETPCSGKELFDWASSVERTIYKTIDSFIQPDQPDIEGHDELFTLSVLHPKNLKVNGNEVCTRVLFMLDDAHSLSIDQRNSLKQYVIEKRGDFSLWISERLEALETQENLRTYVDRDYNVINLENFWNSAPNSKRFEKVLGSISEKRAAISTEDVDTFQGYLEKEFNEESNKKGIENAIVDINQRIQLMSTYTDRFDIWLEAIGRYKGSSYDKAIYLRAVEILMNRNQIKGQLSLDFQLTELELKEKLGSSGLFSAAKLFLFHESKLPYYFGFGMLSQLSSSNIEQFLSFSGILYEMMISNKRSGKDIELDNKIQDKVLRGAVKKKWNELPRVVPFQSQVIPFLNNLGEYCKKETYKPNAPYSPGVTGFSIKVVKGKLIEDENWLDSDSYRPLRDVISTCVAFNLLEIRETSQGKKGELWDVFYLNRWLCIKYDLPFSYGGWRHKSPNDLTKWIKSKK